MIIELKKQKDTDSRGRKNSTVNDVFSAVSFVIRARGKDEVRPILTYMVVESDNDGKKTLACTDGRRLHFSNPIENLNFEPGLYRILKATPSLVWLDYLPPSPLIGTYPSWRQVVPTNATCETEVTYSQASGEFALCVDIHKATGAFFNLPYVIDCFPVGKYAKVIIAVEPAKDGLNAAIIRHEQGTAVLMSMHH